MLSNRLRQEDGTSLVEFALVLPLLLLLLLGMLDFGKAINYWLDDTHLANEGARFAAVEQAAGDISTPAFQNGNCPASPAGSGCNSAIGVCITTPDGAVVGGRVNVKVLTDYTWLSYITSKIGGAATTHLVSSTTMRLEAPASDVSGSVNWPGVC